MINELRVEFAIIKDTYAYPSNVMYQCSAPAGRHWSAPITQQKQPPLSLKSVESDLEKMQNGIICLKKI
jgi:hypothetical protein